MKQAAFNARLCQKPGAGSRQTQSSPRGAILFWTIVMIPVLLAMGLITVDMGSIYVNKSQLQAASDSTAKFAAVALRAGDPAQARANAKMAIHDGLVGGKYLTLDDADIEFGIWTARSATFTPVTASEANSATAVRITARMRQADGTGSDSFYGSMFGYDGYDLTVTSVAAIGTPVALDIPAKASPYLAGTGPGGKIAYERYSPGFGPEYIYWNEHQPLQVEIALEPGEKLIFRDTAGTVGHAGLSGVGGDGITDWIVKQNDVNGFKGSHLPLNALTGVFLDDNAPATTHGPPGAHYCIRADQEALVHEPEVKQVFFIGDGIRNSDSTLQEFVVPDGATRLFLGISDELGWWWDNHGTFSTTLFKGDVQLVG